MSHPDQDGDILPPGYKVEPLRDTGAAAAIELARELAYKNHVRHQALSRMKRAKMESMHEMSLKPKLELRPDRHAMLAGQPHIKSSGGDFEFDNIDVDGGGNLFQGPKYGILPYTATPELHSIKAMDEFQQMTQDIRREKDNRE